MKYFIDHKSRRVHSQKFAGDSCGFVSTPVNDREFTNHKPYVTQLIEDENYQKCPHCVKASTHLEKKALSLEKRPRKSAADQ